MKYKTFRNIVIAVAVVGGGTGIFFLARGCGGGGGEAGTTGAGPTRTATPVVAPTAVSATPTSRSTPTPTPTPTAVSTRAGEELREVDHRVIEAIKRPISGDKVKDAFKSQSYKVNLYRDAGAPGVNRVKIDLDRDEKWDEKWTIERDGAAVEIKRQVAPNDDESYSVEYRLRGGAWVRKE